MPTLNHPHQKQKGGRKQKGEETTPLLASVSSQVFTPPGHTFIHPPTRPSLQLDRQPALSRCPRGKTRNRTSEGAQTNCSAASRPRKVSRARRPLPHPGRPVGKHIRDVSAMKRLKLQKSPPRSLTCSKSNTKTTQKRDESQISANKPQRSGLRSKSDQPLQLPCRPGRGAVTRPPPTPHPCTIQVTHLNPLFHRRLFKDGNHPYVSRRAYLQTPTPTGTCLGRDINDALGTGLFAWTFHKLA